MNEIVAAKVRQAQQLMHEFDLPAWIVQFARETYDHPAPLDDLLIGTSVTWPAAFILTASGESIAIVGTGDVTNVQGVGVYQRVEGYVKDVGEPLRAHLERLDPSQIGVSWSLHDDHADTITHGMYVLLQQILEGTPYADRVVSADRVLVALRARKLPVEVGRIRAAVESTLDLFERIEQMLVPGIMERDVVRSIHGVIESAGLRTAWDSRYDPVVNFGPNSSFGHASAGTIRLEPGMLVHVDLGVRRDGYCSDLQRMWYLLRTGETAAPDEVQRGFDTLVQSMEAGVAALKPGVEGWQVDAAAREVLVRAGYEEPQFALGHQLGSTTHDGGALLGPRWARYGDRPEMTIEEGNVFTIEFGVPSPAGIIALEEDVLVGRDGAEYLTEPQKRLVCLPR